MCPSVTLAGQEVIVYTRLNLAYPTLHGHPYRGFCRDVNFNFSNIFIFLIFGNDPSHLEIMTGCFQGAGISHCNAKSSEGRLAVLWQSSRWQSYMFICVCLQVFVAQHGSRSCWWFRQPVSYQNKSVLERRFLGCTLVSKLIPKLKQENLYSLTAQPPCQVRSSPRTK